MSRTKELVDAIKRMNQALGMYLAISANMLSPLILLVSKQARYADSILALIVHLPARIPVHDALSDGILRIAVCGRDIRSYTVR